MCAFYKRRIRPAQVIRLTVADAGILKRGAEDNLSASSSFFKSQMHATNYIHFMRKGGSLKKILSQYGAAAPPPPHWIRHWLLTLVRNCRVIVSKWQKWRKCLITTHVTSLALYTKSRGGVGAVEKDESSHDYRKVAGTVQIVTWVTWLLRTQSHR